MYVFVLPVSGGGFVSQLGILQHICEAKILPKLILSSSGGNVAAYIAAAAEWNWAAIQRVASDLSQDLFASPWNSTVSLSMVLGYFKGNIYNKGLGVYECLNKFFNNKTIMDYEIWTGTYNKTQQKSRLFCNKNNETTILDISVIDYNLTQSLTPVFTNGNIELIGKVAIASASIPGIVPAEIINGEEYVDGGIACSSPLIIMSDPILKYIKDHQSPLHLIYINSVDLSNPNINTCNNVLDTLRQVTRDLVRSQTLVDRSSGILLLKLASNVLYSTYPSLQSAEFICNHDNLQKIKNLQKKIHYSMIEIYPTQNCDVDIVKFNGDDVIVSIQKAYYNCRCRLWWIPSPTLTEKDFQEINCVLNACS